MVRRIIGGVPGCVSLWAVMLFIGCGGDECPPGTMRVGAACVAVQLDGGFETCNGRDDDLDGMIDEFDADIGMACGETEGACEAGMLECQDGTLVCVGAVGPADETCDGTDNDCDGTVDEGLLSTFYQDLDGDGFGSDVSCEACFASDCQGDGDWLDASGDCDDTCRGCTPDGFELCDEIDNDCDGSTDEELTIEAYVDEDRDGFGVGEVMNLCPVGEMPPLGFATQEGDCADGDARAYPGQETHFSAPIEGDVEMDLTFDFNCDGLEIRENDACDSCRNGGCWDDAPGGYTSDVACGEMGWFQPGGPFMEICIPGMDSGVRAVKCR